MPSAAQQRFARAFHIRRSLNQRNHFVNIRQRNGFAFGDVPFGAGFFQAKQRAARYHFAAVAQKFAQDLFQIEQARLPIHQRHHVDAKGVLQLGELIQLI